MISERGFANDVAKSLCSLTAVSFRVLIGVLFCPRVVCFVFAYVFRALVVYY